MSDSGLYKDEHTVRITAAFVVVLTSFTFLSSWRFPAFLLITDFALRAFTRQLSPLSGVAETVVDALGWPPKPIFAAPKKFAALLGFIFSSIILVALLYERPVLTYTAGGILFIFAFLEAVLNISLGCYVYNWLLLPFINRRIAKNMGKE